MVITFAEIGTHLATRYMGALVREKVTAALQKGDVTFDFNGVETVSDSFADECYGKLFSKFDQGVIVKRIHFKDASPFVKSIFEKTIKDEELEMA